MRKEESKLIRSLAEKGYYRQLLGKTRKNQRTLAHFLKNYEMNGQAHVYEKMHAARKQFVSPMVLPDAEYAERWLEEHQAMADAYPSTRPKSGEFVTEKGEIVRSKSEKIIADLLYRLGIPYVYECPLKLPGGTIHPDFTILNVRTREVFIWEHRGRMDKEDYVDDAMRRERLYAEGGFFPGRGLLYSEETGNYPLQTRDIEAMARAVLM